MTYRRMIGGLMYLTTSRPDIAFATFVCARYQARPMVKHLKEVKWIFRYLRESYNMCLWYLKDFGFEQIAYSDADHAGCKDDYKITSESLLFFGKKLVSKSSKKQDCTAMSTAEDEYVSLSACCAQVIRMRTQLLVYFNKYNRIPMYYDSKSAIAISCNPVQHSRTKHIDIRFRIVDSISVFHRLPKTATGQDMIWVIIDRLTKSAHFLSMREDDTMEKLTRQYLKEVVSRNEVPVLIISDQDGRFASHF
ncbi:retrovirus-related pol polyprotein from transposon TNT 1-94 [Tanacetum coccineum]